MSNDANNSPYVGITEAAIAAGCSPENIYRLVRLGRVGSEGNPKKVRIDEVVAVLERNRA